MNFPKQGMRRELRAIERKFKELPASRWAAQEAAGIAEMGGRRLGLILPSQALDDAADGWRGDMPARPAGAEPGLRPTGP